MPKKHASAIFGTPLTSHLIELGVDTLIVTICTTSGCVHASVVDACSLNFKVIVRHECVYDRGQLPHVISLFDMSQTHADVVPTSKLIKAMCRIKSSVSKSKRFSLVLTSLSDSPSKAAAAQVRNRHGRGSMCESPIYF